MKEIIIKSIDDFHKRIDNYKKSSWFKFRGQSDSSWELIPKVGRPQFVDINDISMFNQWKRRARAHLEKEQYTDWELLAIAQHTGLPTRLLDWTHNPLTAAFFATADNFLNDGAIFVYKPEATVNHEASLPFDASLAKEMIGFYQPTVPSNRIANQFSYFSIHNIPTTPLNDSTKSGLLEKLIIKKDLKNDLLFKLNQYGVNYLTLFPDLEGLSKHLSWWAENYKYWDNSFDATL